MRLKPLVTALCAGALLAATPFAQAKDLKSIGVTVGDLANPFFVQITKGAELEARKLAGDNVKVTLVSSGYDLGQQVSQIDNFHCRESGHDHPQRCGFQRDRPGGKTRQRGGDRGRGG